MELTITLSENLTLTLTLTLNRSAPRIQYVCHVRYEDDDNEELFDEADNGNVEKLDDAQNISDQSWDDEVAGELAKLRAELSAATANN